VDAVNALPPQSSNASFAEPTTSLYVQAMTGRTKLLLVPALPVALGRTPPGPVRAAGRSRHLGRVGSAALAAGMVASVGLGTSPATAVAASRALGASGPVPGTIFVANAGADGNGSAGTGPGSITLYRPGAGGNARPEATVTKGVDGPGSITFDALGDLWVANQLGSSGTGTIVEYSRAGLAKASPVPSVTISYMAGSLSFDPSGDLWAGNGSTAVEFTKSQLARSGAPKPVVTLSPITCSIGFDPSGNLWQGSSADSLSEWAKAGLTKSGSPAPKVTISWSKLKAPCKPAFDRSGNLWVASYFGTNTVEFTKAQLARNGSQAPKVVISSSSLSGPGDVAVSSADALWVPSSGNNTVVEFTKAQLARSGSPAPALTIVGPATGLNWPRAIAIEP